MGYGSESFIEYLMMPKSGFSNNFTFIEMASLMSKSELSTCYVKSFGSNYDMQSFLQILKGFKPAGEMEIGTFLLDVAKQILDPNGDRFNINIVDYHAVGFSTGTIANALGVTTGTVDFLINKEKAMKNSENPSKKDVEDFFNLLREKMSETLPEAAGVQAGPSTASLTGNRVEDHVVAQESVVDNDHSRISMATPMPTVNNIPLHLLYKLAPEAARICRGNIDGILRHMSPEEFIMLHYEVIHKEGLESDAKDLLLTNIYKYLCVKPAVGSYDKLLECDNKLEGLINFDKTWKFKLNHVIELDRGLEGEVKERITKDPEEGSIQHTLLTDLKAFLQDNTGIKLSSMIKGSPRFQRFLVVNIDRRCTNHGQLNSQ